LPRQSAVQMKSSACSPPLLFAVDRHSLLSTLSGMHRSRHIARETKGRGRSGSSEKAARKCRLENTVLL
jgi:hypothetical protein